MTRRGVFDTWQPKYAARGIPTIPVKFVVVRNDKIEKLPAVSNWTKMGLPASTNLTRKFSDSDGIGLCLGPRNGLAVVDVDSRDENLVADAMAYHGRSPLVVRSPSGGLHIYYRHDGRQRRQARCHPHWKARGAPIDVLGAGLAVVPASHNTRGSYEFIQGGLDDFRNLPTLQNGNQPVASDGIYPRNSMRGMREHDGRNNALFRLVGPIARDVHLQGGTRERVLEIAHHLNSECAEPMENNEVMQIVNSVWGLQIYGRNHIGRPGAFCDLLDLDRMATEDQDALVLLIFLRAHNGGVFMVANGLAPRLGWGRDRLARARQSLLRRGYLKALRQAGRGHPALFEFGYPY